jgi:hypothetical protein
MFFDCLFQTRIHVPLKEEACRFHLNLFVKFQNSREKIAG